MSKDILKLEPQAVWKHFYSLTQIPRPSKHEQKVADFVAKFGRDNGLETIVDEVGNVIIRKPATKGMENLKGIILQGHLDMVPQKNSDKQHDFEKDPIETVIDGEWVTAMALHLEPIMESEWQLQWRPSRINRWYMVPLRHFLP